MRTGIILLLISSVVLGQDKNIIKILVENKIKNHDSASSIIKPPVIQQIKQEELPNFQNQTQSKNIEQILCAQQLIGSPQSEVIAAKKFSEDVSKREPERVRFLLFFSAYNIKELKQEEIYYVLSFWIHSLTSPGFNIVAPPKRVPYSPTLYYIYFDDYGWKRESWEAVVQTEPYFRAPWVHFEDLGNLRILTGSNSIVRADWFIVHTSDVTKQVDRNVADILYYILIYGKGKEPKNLKEFQDAWGINLVDARQRGLDAAAIVRGKIVTRDDHNRQLLRVRSGTGYYWETYDVKNQDRERDYIENLFPDDNARDAAEAIVSNNVGMQVYHLEAFKDGKGARVEFGDPSVVRSLKDVHGDTRVRTARSCVSCHAEGIINFKHELKALLCKNEFCVNLAARKKEIQLEIKRFYFAPIEEFVQDDKTFFSRNLKLINNQAPIDNALMYNNVMYNYEHALDLETAARECGTTVEIFIDRLKISVSGRLLDLINDKTIPRAIWENQIINAGTFGHAMLFVSATEKKDINYNQNHSNLQPANLQPNFYPNSQQNQPLIPNIPTNINLQNKIKNRYIPNNSKMSGPTIPNIPNIPNIQNMPTVTIPSKTILKENAWMWGYDLPNEIKAHHSFVHRDSKWHEGMLKNIGNREIILDTKYREIGTGGNFWYRGIIKANIDGQLIESKWYVLEKDLIK